MRLAMPELCSHTTAPRATVRAVLYAGLDSILAPRLSTTAARQRSELLHHLSLVHLSASPDIRALKLCSYANGNLVNAKLYRLMTMGGERSQHNAFIWRSCAPSKVKFFTWLLYQDRIQSRANLLRKTILEEEAAGCPIGAAPLEMAAHIMFQCPFAMQFWHDLGARGTTTTTITGVANCPLPPSAPTRSASTLRQLCFWQLWEHRNGVVFNGLSPSMAVLRKLWRDDATL
ncbi:unnamed protein product [Alopecurus aequalis]